VSFKDFAGGRDWGAMSGGELARAICLIGAVRRAGSVFCVVTAVFARAIEEVEDGLAVGVGERGEQLGRGGGWLSVVRVVVALDLSLIGVEFGFGAIPPAEEVAEALLGRGGPGKQRSLVRVEQVAKCLEPALLDVLAPAGGEVGEHGEDVVVEVMQAGEGCDAVPGQVVEVGEFFQEPHHLCGAGRGPAAGPRGPVLPELEDRGAGVGGAGVSVGCGGGMGLIGRLKKCGGVVGEPSGEGAVGVAGVEFGKDALAEGSDRVSCQRRIRGRR
jgi:hypothetical protein